VMPTEICGRKQLGTDITITHLEVGVALKLVTTVTAYPMPATTIGICPPAPMMIICPTHVSFTSLEWITATGMVETGDKIPATLLGTETARPATIGLRVPTMRAMPGECTTTMGRRATDRRRVTGGCVASARSKIEFDNF